MRVQFTLNEYMLQSSSVMRAARTVFGQRVGRWERSALPLTIECSADMLVAFLVLRDGTGATNSWKALKVQVFDGCGFTKTSVQQEAEFAFKQAEARLEATIATAKRDIDAAEATLAAARARVNTAINSKEVF